MISKPTASTRITPARAGKSIENIKFLPVERDHPRACGEKRAGARDGFPHQGSPPRVRGKVYSAKKIGRNWGITPARAGKRYLTFFAALQGGDHPRACGEKQEVVLPVTPQQGSPPRVRGKACVCDLQRAPRGITPARAGKRALRFSFSALSWDHPRACGEKIKAFPDSRTWTGSPPRVRGKDARHV